MPVPTSTICPMVMSNVERDQGFLNADPLAANAWIYDHDPVADLSR